MSPHRVWTFLILVLTTIFTTTTPLFAQRSSESVWLVTGGTVLTMNSQGSRFENGAVAIEGSRIVAVGNESELSKQYPDAHRIDASGKVVLPGLINAHTHVPMTLFRGFADDLDLMTFLHQRIFPAEAAHVDEDFVRTGTRLGCLELLRGGVTTFVDMYYYEDAIAEEAAACGIRAVLGETLIDFPAPDHETWEQAIAYTESFLERWKGHTRIHAAVAPHAVYTVSGPHLVEAHALAEKYDAPMLIHLAEAPAELEGVLKEHGKRSVEYLHELGILDSRVIAAHMVWPDSGEIELLAKAGVGAVHCPQSNMKVAAGVAPVPALLAGGVAVGLGTDGAASNNDLSLWEEMDTAAKLHKLEARDPTVLPAREVLRMSTIGGAEAIGMEAEIGSLEVGKRADLIVVGLDGWHQIPVYDIESSLVYATKASDVDLVIVDGQIVMSDGHVLTLDETSLRSEVESQRQGIQVVEIAAGSSDRFKKKEKTGNDMLPNTDEDSRCSSRASWTEAFLKKSERLAPEPRLGVLAVRPHQR